MRPVRMNEELYKKLAEHAQADGRSMIKELEIILVLYFDDLGEDLPRTSKTLQDTSTTPDKPARPSKVLTDKENPVTTETPRFLNYAAAVDRTTNGTCKVHGAPLDVRGKCLQKGCKYA